MSLIPNKSILDRWFLCYAAAMALFVASPPAFAQDSGNGNSNDNSASETADDDEADEDEEAADEESEEAESEEDTAAGDEEQSEEVSEEAVQEPAADEEATTEPPAESSEFDDLFGGDISPEDEAILSKPYQELTPDEKRRHRELTRMLMDGKSAWPTGDEPTTPARPTRPARPARTLPGAQPEDPARPARPGRTFTPPTRTRPGRVTPPVPGQVPGVPVQDDQPPAPPMDEVQRPAVPPTPRRTSPPPEGTGTVVETPELPDDNLTKPYDQRLYSFGLQDGNYIELVRMFARKSGLPVLGVPVELINEQPEASVISYVSAVPTDFRTTLHQINDLLYHEVVPALYLYLNEDKANPANTRLELFALKEMKQQLPPNRLFLSVEAVEEAGLMGSEVIRVYFDPGGATAMKVFEQFVSLMLDDKSLRALDPKTGRIDFTGRVDELQKMLYYMKLFTSVLEEGESVKRLAVGNLKPSEALEMLKMLVEGIEGDAGAAARTPRRRGRGEPEDQLSADSERVVVIPDDAHASLLVSGLPHKVREVEVALKVIDIPDEDPTIPDLPYVLQLQHARAEDAADLLNSLINVPDEEAAAAPKNPRRRNRRTSGSSSFGGAGSDLRITPEPRQNALILQGSQELVNYAVDLTTRFIDVPAGSGAFRRIELQHADPSELAETVKTLIGGGARSKENPPFEIIPTVRALIFKGDPQQMAEAEEIIAQLDIDNGERVDTFIIQLERAQPSFVIEILKSVESAAAAAAPAESAKGKPVRRNRRRSGDGRFFADDAGGKLYFTGTQTEWENEIRPVIEKIDREATVTRPGGVFVPVQVADIAEVSKVLATLYAPRGEEGLKFAEAPTGIIVGGDPTEDELAAVRETIAMLDTQQPQEEQVRRIFPIEHVDQEVIVKAIQDLYLQGGPRGRRGPRRGGAAAAEEVQMRIASSPNGIVMIGTEAELQEVGDLIVSLDQPQDRSEIVLNKIVVQHADAAEIAGQLLNLLKVKEEELASTGQLADPKARRGGSLISVEADPRTSSVLIGAPQEIQEYAAEVIAKLDVAVDETPPPVMDFYECRNASAETLAEMLKAIFGGGGSAPSVISSASPKSDDPRDRAVQRRNRLRELISGGADNPIKITPLPGDKVISISAPTRIELDSILAQARMLDDKSSSTEKISRQFSIQYADVIELADAIIQMFDAPGRGAVRPKAAAAEEESFFLVDVDDSPRVGEEIAVWPRYANRILLVQAPPAKMAAIEHFIAQAEEISNPQNTTVVEEAPWEFYFTKNVSAVEAADAADSFIYKMMGSSAPVEVGSLDRKTVYIKGNKNYFKTVRDYLEQYVDVERADMGPVISITALPANLPRKDLFEMLQGYLPDDVELEIIDLSEQQAPGENTVPEIRIAP